MNRPTSFIALLCAMLRDHAGNAMMVMGFALIPIVGMIGSGVDLSRAYLAKTRMQQACDAGALAGRRVLTANQFNSAVSAEATRFFNFNYRQGENATSAVTPVVTMPTNGVIHVVASSAVPTAVMQIFGITTMPISVQCDASQDFVNTDVVLVLDTTGSMTCLPSDPASCSQATEKSGSKMQGMRDAVMAFYDALKPVQDQLQANGLRLRYSVVPYSSSVNVGNEIRQINPAYMVNTTRAYRSRYAASPSDVTWTQSGSTTSTQNLGSQSASQSDCTTYGPGIVAPYNRAAQDSYSTSGKTKTTTQTTTRVSWSNGTCTGYADTTTTTSQRTTNWTYGMVTRDVSQFVQGSAVEEQSVDTDSQVRWNGCIEERQTANSITTGSSITPPAAANDLNLTMVPTSDNATRWSPMWPTTVWLNNGTTGYRSLDLGVAACPGEASRLKAWQRSDMLSFVNGLQAGGSTYHDVGMLWGARMLAPYGIFATDNPTTYNNMPVQRFVIFMTDGYMAPLGVAYSAYGAEAQQNPTRVTPSYSNDADLTARHIRRFNIACQQAKNLVDANGNRAIASIWAISFGSGSTVDSNLQSCASSPSQAKQATDSNALIAAFVAIGNTIGSLRLTR